MQEPHRKPVSPESKRALEVLERLVPWVVFAMVVAIVVLSVLASILGAPRAPWSS